MKIMTALALVLLVAPRVHAADGSIPVSNWQVNRSPGASPLTTSVGWEPIPAPRFVKGRCRQAGGPCPVWFRGEFLVPGDPNRYYGITLGRSFHTDDVFLNGTLIGSQLPGDLTNIHYPSSYLIPAGVVKKGMNRLLVSVGVYGDEWGGLPDPVAIHHRWEFLQRKMYYETIFDKIPFSLAVSLTAFMIVILIFYLWNRKNTLFLYGALMILAMIAYIIALFSPHALLFVPVDAVFIAHWLIYPVMASFVIIFIQSLYRVYFVFQNLVVFSLFGALTALTVASHALAYPFHLRPALAMMSEILLVAYVVYILKQLPRNRQDRFKFNGIIVLIVASPAVAAWDITAYLTGARTALLVPAFGSLILTLINMVLGGRDVYSRLRSAERLYDPLKSRTEKKPRSITNESEEKLKWVVEFIREHYRSDISREGLSEAVGMHPDYMSKLFRAYTGMKINEYINTLRIEEAAGRLRTDAANIIDIAFSVGFDNIVSFNRSFKSIMNLTPSAYRAENRPKD